MTRGRYANAAKARRIEELEHENAALTEKISVLEDEKAELHKQCNLLRGKDSSLRMKQAAELARNDIAALAENHRRELAVAQHRTAELLDYLVEVVAAVNRGEIAAGQTPADLPGLLHHFAPVSASSAGELFARAVGAHGSDDPDIAVMATRRNRRADVNDYRGEAARRAERGLDSDPVLTDPQVWRRRIHKDEESKKGRP